MRRCRTCSAPRTRDSARWRTARSVEAGLEALEERERRIVELRFFEGLTQSEIAARVGISQMHVSRLLRRRCHLMRGPARRARSRGTSREPRVVTLAIPARTEYLILARLALAGIAHEVPIEQGTLADLKLAVTEACGNASGTPIPRARASSRSATRWRRTGSRSRVEDDGPGIPEPVSRSLPAVELTEGGMGLAIIDALVEEVEIGASTKGRGRRYVCAHIRHRPPGSRGRSGRSGPGPGTPGGSVRASVPATPREAAEGDEPHESDEDAEPEAPDRSPPGSPRSRGTRRSRFPPPHVDPCPSFAIASAAPLAASRRCTPADAAWPRAGHGQEKGERHAPRSLPSR